MKAFVKKEDYCIVLDRRTGEIDALGKSQLESGLMDYEKQRHTGIVVKLRVGPVQGKTTVDMTKESTTFYFTATEQLTSSIIHGGIYKDKYDNKHYLHVTDGIMPQNFLWSQPKGFKR